MPQQIIENAVGASGLFGEPAHAELQDRGLVHPWDPVPPRAGRFKHLQVPSLDDPSRSGSGFLSDLSRPAIARSGLKANSRSPWVGEIRTVWWGVYQGIAGLVLLRKGSVAARPNCRAAALIQCIPQGGDLLGPRPAYLPSGRGVSSVRYPTQVSDCAPL